MKATLILLLALVPFFSVSCTNSTDDDIPTVVYALAYIVESTGVNATVTQVDYTATDGTNTTLVNPTLPLTVTVSRTNGETAQLVVAGTTGATSEITARIQDDPNVVTTPVTYASATCLENSTPCGIDIQNTF